MTRPDLIAEHAALTRERDALQALVLAEWETMGYQAALMRQARHSKITDRLAQIERTRTWKGRTQETK